MLVALLAVAIGAAILSGLITIYVDVPRQMGQEFRSYGANLIFLPAANETGVSKTSLEKAVAALPQADIVGVAPYRYQTIKINELPYMAAGTALAEAKKTSPYWLVDGAWPQGAGQVLIGQEIADATGIPIGGKVTAAGTNAAGEGFNGTFTVSGTVQTGGAEEAFLFLSLEDFAGLQGADGPYDVVECSIAATQATLEDAARRIAAQDGGVAVRLVKRVTQSEGTVLTKLRALVWIVTVIVLLLTMICVATTMMAVVAERRKEIGLRKALGAANNSVMLEFLGEGVFLGLLGGLLGAGLGFLFAQLVSMNVFGRSITFLPQLIPVTLLAAAAVTALACLIPVRRTADIDPALVLKGE
jgi:putative ABC transport system permease protein